MLQADSKDMFDAWILALQKGIGAAIQRINSYSSDCDEKKQIQGIHVFSTSNENNKAHNVASDKNKKVKKVRLVLLLNCINNCFIINLKLLTKCC